jgi:hypothetical protein
LYLNQELKKSILKLWIVAFIKTKGTRGNFSWAFYESAGRHGTRDRCQNLTRNDASWSSLAQMHGASACALATVHIKLPGTTHQQFRMDRNFQHDYRIKSMEFSSLVTVT